MSFKKYKNDKFYKAVADHLGIKYNSQSAFNQIKNYAKKKGVSALNSQNDLNKIIGKGNNNNNNNNDKDLLKGIDGNNSNENKLESLYSKGQDKVKDFNKNTAVQSVVDMSNVDVGTKAAGGVRMASISDARKAMLRGGVKAAFHRSGKRIKKIKETFN